MHRVMGRGNTYSCSLLHMDDKCVVVVKSFEFFPQRSHLSSDDALMSLSLCKYYNVGNHCAN